MSGEGTKQKIETYGYYFCSLCWHAKCSIIFSTPKAWCLMHSRYNYKKTRSFGWIRKSLCFAGRCRKKNSQCRMTDVGVWGRSRRRQGGLGAEHSAFCGFYNFL